MRVLVTGGTGFVGSHTAIALGAAGHEVRLLVRSPAKAERVYAERGVDLPGDFQPSRDPVDPEDESR